MLVTIVTFPWAEELFQWPISRGSIWFQSFLPRHCRLLGFALACCAGATPPRNPAGKLCPGDCLRQNLGRKTFASSEHCLSSAK